MAARRRAAVLAPLAAVPLALALLLATAASASAVQPGPGAATYTVRPGDTLWSISRRTGVPVDVLAGANGLANPDRLRAGATLVLDAAPPEPAGPEAARRLLAAAAGEQRLSPGFVLAVSRWESGFDQTAISRDGAVGLMQILPVTAEWAGPALLGARVNVYRARDNARLGAALLRRYLDEFGDPRLALAAFYQGERGTRERGIYPGSHRYVDGIMALWQRGG